MKRSTHKLTREQRMAWWKAWLWCHFWFGFGMKPTITSRQVGACPELCMSYKDGKGWCDQGTCSLARTEIVAITATTEKGDIVKAFWPAWLAKEK